MRGRFDVDAGEDPFGDSGGACKRGMLGILGSQDWFPVSLVSDSCRLRDMFITERGKAAPPRQVSEFDLDDQDQNKLVCYIRIGQLPFLAVS